nr:immunoglobulin light chain junction region [Macaca mulatta]MOX17060.1 immunoglobulin light chain junction region [Macaca mulatta]MOX17226.1 immunoglobulin light chain junction region [Macaca mulatta]MOX17296.1 immunoglobulin light chain junction region [Macaca mulatta]MOX18036.1 immunoglobulin light chain junction region [Macaca mulatta]
DYYCQSYDSSNMLF